MRMLTPHTGTNGTPDRIPQSGDLQGFGKKSALRLSHACIRAWDGLRSEYEPALGAFVLAMAALAIGIALTLVLTGTGVGSGWSVLALCCVAAISERGRIRLTSTTEESISLLPTLFAAVLFGPLAAMAVGAASLVTEIGQPPYLKWFTYTSTRALGGAATGLVSLVVLGRLGDDLGGIAIATTVGALVAQLLDVAFAVVVARLRGTRTPLDLIRTLAPLIVAWIPMYAPVVTLLALAYWQLSPLTLPLFFAPALVAQRMYVLYQEQRRLTVDVLSANEQLERANFSFATALVATLDARDRYTAGHSAAVAVYARDIAARMGLSSEQQQLVHLCGLVHDIGKVGLPAGLLEKPGPLTLDERRSMEKHSEIGERILANVDDYADPAPVPNHRGCGRVQRDDLTSPVPRCNAQPRSTPTPRSSCGEPV